MGDADWLSANSSALGSCGSVLDYDKLNRISEGTYGYVYRAVHRESGRVIALKRIILHNEAHDGFPLTSIREIKTLKMCQHPNIVQLQDIVVGPRRDAVFLLFEYCEHDLSMLLKLKNPFKESEAKCLSLQLLRAVEFIHKKWIVHRDIKMSNLLYTNSGCLKLADFGLARCISQPPPANLTQKVVTLWYRAPELLLGSERYSFPVDIWSVGCIIGELLLGRPLMHGDNELQQISAIFNLLGAPTERIWPGLGDLPMVSHINLTRDQLRYPYNNLPSVLPGLSASGLALLQDLFAYCPSLRATARHALQHSYWETKPYSTEQDLMPTFPVQSAGQETVPAV